MGLPITTTIAGKWLLNSVILHGDDKYIIANGQTIINGGDDKMSCDDYSFNAQNKLCEYKLHKAVFLLIFQF